MDIRQLCMGADGLLAACRAGLRRTRPARRGRGRGIAVNALTGSSPHEPCGTGRAGGGGEAPQEDRRGPGCAGPVWSMCSFAQLVDDPSAWPEEFATEEEQARERSRLPRWRSSKRWCRGKVNHVLGLARNPCLVRRIGKALRKSRRRCAHTGEASRRFRQFRYRTRDNEHILRKAALRDRALARPWTRWDATAERRS